MKLKIRSVQLDMNSFIVNFERFSRFPEHLFFRTHLIVLKSIEFM